MSLHQDQFAESYATPDDIELIISADGPIWAVEPFGNTAAWWETPSPQLYLDPVWRERSGLAPSWLVVSTLQDGRVPFADGGWLIIRRDAKPESRDRYDDTIAAVLRQRLGVRIDPQPTETSTHYGLHRYERVGDGQAGP